MAQRSSEIIAVIQAKTPYRRQKESQLELKDEENRGPQLSPDLNEIPVLNAKACF